MATGHGGSRKGAGRKVGAINKLTKIEKESLKTYCEETGADPFRYWADTLSDRVDARVIKSAIKAGLSEKEAFEIVYRTKERLKMSAAKNLAPFLMSPVKQEIGFDPETQEALLTFREQVEGKRKMVEERRNGAGADSSAIAERVDSSSN